MNARAARQNRRGVGRRKDGRRHGDQMGQTPTPPVSAPEIAACRLVPWRVPLKTGPTDWPPLRWYGTSPVWRVALEASARREYGDRLRVTEGQGTLEYRIALDVRGPNDLVDVKIMFYVAPVYDTYGLSPQDYPRVWAETGLPSKHRMPDDALCLYHPIDPAEHRWTPDKGLLDLLYLVVDHLAYEAHWRAGGGWATGQWLGDEAPHGFTQEAAA